MLSWKPMQKASAFKTYCRGIGMDISEYADISQELDKYEHDKKWAKIIEESKRFIGVVESVSESPCSMLLYDKPVKDELGLVRTISEDKSTQKTEAPICCLLDGYNCDKYKYLKNDYLTVTTWAIIRDTCEAAGISIPTIREFDALLDDKTFDIYKNGLTCTINQADSDFATPLVKEYQPRNVSEMSAFVAIIRPGCASLLNGFIHREPYTTGVPELDELLEDSGHRLIYQESIMKYLIWLGIPEAGSYDIIKKISKKKFKEPELAALKQQLIAGWMKRVGREEGFNETWTVVEQAARYSFNASHSLSYAYDSLYGAYLKSHYPLEYYSTVFNYYSCDMKRTARLSKELQFFGIGLHPARFRYSRAGYTLSREDNNIYKGIASIKHLNKIVAEEMYELRDNKYDSFADLLFDLKKTRLTAQQLDILIRLNFFCEFGDINKLLAQVEVFNKFYGKVQIKKSYLEENGIPIELARECADQETAKLLKADNIRKFIILASQYVSYKKCSIKERIAAQVEYIGYIDISGQEYSGLAVVVDVDKRYTPRLTLYSLKNGTNIVCKISKTIFKKEPLEKGEIVRITSQRRKQKVRMSESGDWVKIPNEFEWWVDGYKVVNDL